MARFIKDIQTNAAPDVLFNAVSQYLASEGYQYTTYQNEQVFQKGQGIMTGPTFVKLSFFGNMVRLEAWMKWALLPGVFVGEMGLTGFMGCAVKAPLKNRVAQIENIIYQISNAPVNAPALQQ